MERIDVEAAGILQGFSGASGAADEAERQRQQLGKEAAAWLPTTMSFPRHREFLPIPERLSLSGGQQGLSRRLIGMNFSEVPFADCSSALHISVISLKISTRLRSWFSCELQASLD